MRIFVALDIDDAIRERLRVFVEGVQGFAPDGRWVRPESLHVTLKFIGEKPDAAVEEIKRALAEVRGDSFAIAFRGYGFFPTLKAPRVFWVGIQAGPELERLAATIDEATARLGIPKETHNFSPHLTLARRGEGSSHPRAQKSDVPNPSFRKLHEKLTAMPTPEFGTMTARDFYLYQSQLSRSGSHYTKLERFALRGSEASGTSSPHNL
jgi:RNA 2',3'-cyclic 3'-phosphodiesterase